MSDCDALLDALAEGASPSSLPPSVAAHARRCDACRRALSLERSLAAPPPLAVTQGVALRAALDEDLSPVRYRSPFERSLLPFGAVAAVVLSGATMLDRPMAPTALPWVAAACLLAAACAGVAMVLHRGRSGLGVPVAWRRAFVGGAFALFGVATFASTRADAWMTPSRSRAGHVGVSAIDAMNGAHVDRPFGPMQHLGTCASTGLVFASVVALGLLWASRRTVAVSPGSAGACVGAAAGLAAAAALQLSCASSVSHVIAAHGLPMVAATTFGALLGRRALSP